MRKERKHYAVAIAMERQALAHLSAGAVGLSAIMAARFAGAAIFAVDVVERGHRLTTRPASFRSTSYVGTAFELAHFLTSRQAVQFLRLRHSRNQGIPRSWRLGAPSNR